MSDDNVQSVGEYSGLAAEKFLRDTEAHMGHPTSDEDPSSFVPEGGLTPGGSCRVVPSPVRSNPVPLTVRRHTAQSRAIWRTELLNALPVDMLQEDRERIADDLIDRAIALGDELRRKRLIDKLMTAANAMDYADREPIEMSGHLGDWADLLRDAAEEIRSVL